MEKVTILGAGLVGSLLSICLAKKGYSVQVFERRPDMRKVFAEKGRSINLALSDRGWKGLTDADETVAEEIRKIAIPMHGRMVHDEQGNTTFFPYGKEGQFIYSVSRSILNETLVNLADKNYGVDFVFEQRCLDVDLASKQLLLEHVQTKEKTKIQVGKLFGSDGAFSPLRTAFQKTDRYDFQQFYIEHGYKELTIPAGPNDTFQLEKNALHIWPRKKYMLIALPNLDGSFTCTLFFPFEGATSFNSIKTDQEIKDFFQKDFSDVIPLMPEYVEDFKHNPTASLVTVKCFPWVKGEMALIGDAAHAIVPFYGQGMNAGFEDCCVLSKLMEKHQDNWAAVLAEFQTLRKPDADAIADLALQNFIEMRDLVSDPSFIFRKKIEGRIQKLHPTEWIPLYSMVTFSELRYSEALRLSKIQDKLMKEVLARPSIQNDWENLDYKDVIEEFKKLKSLV